MRVRVSGWLCECVDGCVGGGGVVCKHACVLACVRVCVRVYCIVVCVCRCVCV